MKRKEKKAAPRGRRGGRVSTDAAVKAMFTAPLAPPPFEPANYGDRAAEDKILAAVMKDMQKQYGEGAVARLVDEVYEEVDWIIPTGIPDLDHKVFGVGGLPLGKFVVIIGKESAGKSTLCKVIEAAAGRGAVHYAKRFDSAPERRVVIPYLQDVERSGVLARDMSLGIDIARTLGSPDEHLETLEKCFDLQEKTLTSIRKHGGLGLGILDSVTAPMMEAEKKLDYDDEARRGLRAAFFSRNLKKLMDATLLGGTNGLLFVNQVRENMDAGGMPWAKKTKDAGGFALRFYAHIKIEMIHIGKIKRGDEVIGIEALAQCVRNKLAPPFGEAKLNIYFNPPRVESADAPVRQAAKL